MKKQIIIFCWLLSYSLFAYSEERDAQVTNNGAATQELVPEKQQQQIIQDFKKFVATVPQSVQSEVVEFRKQVATINRQKREMYQSLSQAAQSYLTEEQKYKKKLPIKQKPLINIQTPGEKPVEKF